LVLRVCSNLFLFANAAWAAQLHRMNLHTRFARRALCFGVLSFACAALAEPPLPQIEDLYRTDAPVDSSPSLTAGPRSTAACAWMRRRAR